MYNVDEGRKSFLTCLGNSTIKEPHVNEVTNFETLICAA